jgi:hypothetical protein
MRTRAVATSDERTNVVSDALSLVLGQHSDRADVGVERAVRDGARVAHQLLAIVGGDAVHRPSDHLRQPLGIARAVLPANAVEEGGELLEVERGDASR